METDYPYVRCMDAWQTQSLPTSLTWAFSSHPPSQIPTGSNICHHHYQNCRKLTLKIQISENKGIKMMCSPTFPKDLNYHISILYDRNFQSPSSQTHFFLNFIYLYELQISACVSFCIPYACRCPERLEEGNESPKVIGGCEIPCGCRKTILRPLKEQQMLLTIEPSLLPHRHAIYRWLLILIPEQNRRPGK